MEKRIFDINDEDIAKFENINIQLAQMAASLEKQKNQVSSFNYLFIASFTAAWCFVSYENQILLLFVSLLTYGTNTWKSVVLNRGCNCSCSVTSDAPTLLIEGVPGVTHVLVSDTITCDYIRLIYFLKLLQC